MAREGFSCSADLTLMNEKLGGNRSRKKASDPNNEHPARP